MCVRFCVFDAAQEVIIGQWLSWQALYGSVCILMAPALIPLPSHTGSHCQAASLASSPTLDTVSKNTRCNGISSLSMYTAAFTHTHTLTCSTKIQRWMCTHFIITCGLMHNCTLTNTTHSQIAKGHNAKYYQNCHDFQWNVP